MTNTSDDTLDPRAGLLADLEDLRRSRSKKEADKPNTPAVETLSVLEDIAEAAGHLRDQGTPRGGSIDDDDDAEDIDADDFDGAEDDEGDEDSESAAENPETQAALNLHTGLFSNLPQAEKPLTFTSAQNSEDQETPAVRTFDLRNPFSFAPPVRSDDEAEPLTFDKPSGAGIGALTFQPPQAELGEVVDPDWTPDDEDDEEQDEAATPARDEDTDSSPRRRRGGRGRRSKSKAQDSENTEDDSQQSGTPDEDTSDAGDADTDNAGDQVQQAGDSDDDSGSDSSRRRRRRTRSTTRSAEDSVTGVKGSTRLEAKRQRRREGREAGRRRPVITEAEFLARRESVERSMLVREDNGRTQLVVLEDGIAVEHYLSESKAQASLIGNVYLGKVQNVLPSMEAAFVDIGKGRNAVLYAGEVNWDVLGMDGKPRRIEMALNPGDSVLVQVTKDPIGHKGARLTSQISLPGRFLVFVPGNQMTGISRKLPDSERARLKKLLSEIVPDKDGVIVRTAAEGAAEEELSRDVKRLAKRWESIERKSTSTKVLAPQLLYSEPDMIVRIIRDVFNEDFKELVISGDKVAATITEYVEAVAPDLLERVSKYNGDDDIFDHYRVSEQIEKALNRKVNLPSGGSLVIDRTEAMTVIDVNTGKFTGSGGNLEETVTKNNLEAAEEVIRQLRLRDIGGIIVVDFIDMVLESNRDLVVRRLVECLGRDRTKHQVAEVTSLGLVQMTRKRIGTGLAESFAAAGEDMSGRGLMLPGTEPEPGQKQYKSRKKNRKNSGSQDSAQSSAANPTPAETEQQQASRSAMAAIAKATLKKEPEATPAESEKPAESGTPAIAAEPTAQADSSAAETSAEQEVQGSSVPKVEEASEPTGPAPLMIGQESETKIQAPVKKAAAPKRAGKDSSSKAAAQKPAEQKPAEQRTEPAAPPILIIGE